MTPFRLACLCVALAAPATAQQPVPDTTVIAEAEEFKVQGQGGWRPGVWGENYYCATFANSFLSRKAFAGPGRGGRLVLRN